MSAFIVDNQALATTTKGEASTAAERVFQQVQQAIVEGQIAAGAKLSEPVIAREYGVSRAPLREALSRLENSGLIERRPNVGCRVISLSSRHLLEIYQIREVLESLAAEQAAINMTAAEIEDLQQLLDQHHQQVEADRHYFQKEGDMDFHFRIIKGSKNGKLIAMFQNDLYHLIRLYRFQFGMVSQRVSRAFDEHTQIVDAIRQRDAELAGFLMKRHIRHSRTNTAVMLDQQASMETRVQA